MKNLILIFVIIFSNAAFGNKIDELKTDKDVEDFIKIVAPEFVKKIWKDYDRGNFRIVSTDTIYANLKCQKVFNKSEINNWEKVDINNDGLTDLLFIPHYYGYSQYIIIDEGNNNFNLTRFIIDFDICEYVKPIKVNRENQLKIRKVNRLSFGTISSSEPYIAIDTLTYKFNSFIEFNSKKITQDRVKLIKVKTSYCLGLCPSFELEINYDGHMVFNGLGYTNFIGKSTSNAELKKIQEIEDLINYIDLKNLKDNYSVSWTDSQTIYLEIEFQDGFSKKITDYGLIGTYGLNSLYSKLIDIGTKTNWK
ncbi:hypothetical protein KIH23_06905 [Flavobacterium sp. CYK-55]|uniref:DUF6438 domain-containing protein n=1 Tax=Flavobacterium sp. CYK-55 TaxID=2835529 RepID=UPI001BCADB9D|nr:DUF6438 domain-containing protein [Flavobacterium sp. CYK-55]MBS7787021.1 hypothetical protein [Flavobacterium sp. CYK-55]